MHQDATSLEYAQYMFQYLLKPSVINGITYSQNHFCNIFLTENEIRTAIANLDCGEPGSSVLVCCLLDYYSYTEIKGLVTYIVNNFAELSGFISAGFIFTALDKILRNRTTTNMDYPQLDVIQNLIMNALFERSLPVPTIKPAYDLFERIRKILHLPRDEEKLNRLLAVTSEKAFRRLHCREVGDNSVFMYLNEICLLLQKMPTQDILNLLEVYMEDPMRISVLTSYKPDIYIQLLTLFTTIAMLSKAKVPIAVKLLLENIHNESKIRKVLSFKLLFSLCQEITHEYGEIIKISFREMVAADPCLVRIAAGILEELIHEDYIKLSGEDFFRFGCDDLKIFMRQVLRKRFLLSNQNDIAKFYIQSIVYINMCTKLKNYTIPAQFFEDLVRIKLKVERPQDLLVFLFDKLPIRKKI
ncbi:hypothetical protein NQ317_009971 [Molorchus minor]|uniref:Uncharacterized protein n=1 Tax=Molorchus minor TaxID=1323400 RepID=A0ABQ9K8C2_9CUCU|nr:hypothetical protein NQ317_009971 [Molorchus minor]